MSGIRRYQPLILGIFTKARKHDVSQHTANKTTTTTNFIKWHMHDNYNFFFFVLIPATLV